jgi:NAD(P)-dependent dehydrogenase (short-subunit alcohol dehydrogenase family)
VTTVLITGATDGLGKALALRLAAEGAEVFLHGRDPVRVGQTGIEVGAVASGPRVRTLLADLSDLGQVRRLAMDVMDHTGRLDAFVNNAGIGSGLPAGRDRQTSVDGYELRFAVNYLAGFRLTMDLLDLLRAGAPGRVVNVASLGQHAIDFDDIMIRNGYSGARAYGQSKLAQIMSGFTLASRVPAAEVTFNSLHPGTYMPTKMVMQEIGHSVDTLETGVASTLRLVADPSLDGTTGLFFDRTREARANAQAYDPAARDLLWERSLSLVGL